jgi:hypothetical protein
MSNSKSKLLALFLSKPKERAITHHNRTEVDIKKINYPKVLQSALGQLCELELNLRFVQSRGVIAGEQPKIFANLYSFSKELHFLLFLYHCLSYLVDKDAHSRNISNIKSFDVIQEQPAS